MGFFVNGISAIQLNVIASNSFISVHIHSHLLHEIDEVLINLYLSWIRKRMLNQKYKWYLFPYSQAIVPNSIFLCLQTILKDKQAILLNKQPHFSLNQKSLFLVLKSIQGLLLISVNIKYSL